jgi:hypothetical protein
MSYPQPLRRRRSRPPYINGPLWQASGMDTRSLPTIEVVPRGGRLLWRVCGMGMCVEECSGARAMQMFDALCLSRGIEPPRHGPSLPQRGPSEVDEPGV